MKQFRLANPPPPGFSLTRPGLPQALSIFLPTVLPTLQLRECAVRHTEPVLLVSAVVLPARHTNTTTPA